MRRLVAIIRVTILQLIGRRRSIGLLILAAVPALIFLLITLNVDDREAEEWFRTLILFIMLAVVVPVIAVVIGSASLGDERSQKTISYIALRPIPRELIAVAKLVASWISSFVIAGSGAALAAVVLGASVGSWDEFGAILIATAITTLGFTAVTQTLGYLTDRAVIIGLAYVFIWEDVVTGAASQVATTSIWRMGASAYAGIVAGDHWGSALGLEAQVVADLEDLLAGVNPGAWGALFKVLAISAVSILVLAYFMRERDLVS